MTLGQSGIFLAISATDGKRVCAGVQAQVSDVDVHPPEKTLARVDADSFAAISAHNKCNINPGTAACEQGSYVATFVDLNKDRQVDVLVAGGPFVRGSKTRVVALWLGALPGARKELFVGDCDELGMLSKTEFTCATGGKTEVVSYQGKGGVREASAVELAKSEKVTARVRSVEAKANLKSLFTAEKSFYAERDRFSTNFREVGFDPARGNYYAYFAAPRGTVQSRKGRQIDRLHDYTIVAPDEHAHPGISVPTGLKEAHCPLTFGTSADGEPIGLGVTGESPSQEFIGYAIGNVDDDPDFDCWSIATFERKSKAGVRIPPGEPWHEKSDFKQASAAAEQP